MKKVKNFGMLKNMEDKIEFIDDFLMRCEDWMHGEDGKDVTLCRKYLSELQEQVKNCSILDVVGRSEQLCDCTDPCEETLAMRCTGCGNLTECD